MALLLVMNGHIVSLTFNDAAKLFYVSSFTLMLVVTLKRFHIAYFFDIHNFYVYLVDGKHKWYRLSRFSFIFRSFLNMRSC